jgi:hypothetical protein
MRIPLRFTPNATCAGIEWSESFASETCFAVIGVLIGEMLKGHGTNSAECNTARAVASSNRRGGGCLGHRGERLHGIDAIDANDGVGLGAFETGIGVAERIGKRFAEKIVKFGCGKAVNSLGHGSLLGLG